MKDLITKELLLRWISGIQEEFQDQKISQIKTVLESHFCKVCLRNEEQIEFLSELFVSIMSSQKLDPELINHDWFIDLLSLVKTYNSLDKIHNAKELISRVQELTTTVHDKTIKIVDFREVMKIKQESLIEVLKLFELEHQDIDFQEHMAAIIEFDKQMNGSR